MACAHKLVQTGDVVRMLSASLLLSDKKFISPSSNDTPVWTVNCRYLDSTKMEAATFNIFDTARFKFQVVDAELYYVHHLSMYEHLLHKKFGFEVAQNQTLILSQTAMAGECNNLQITPRNGYLALIPFFGGRPPNVTSDLKVKSIGMGNSLVSVTSTCSA